MIQYRRMVLEDFNNQDFILGLHALLFVSKDRTVEELRAIFESRRETVTFVGVDTDSNTIAACGAVCVYTRLNGERVGIRYDIAVNPNMQRQGIGTAFVQFMIDDMANEHLLWLTSPTAKDIVDSGFYDRLGLVPHEGLTAYISGYSGKLPRLRQAVHPAVIFRPLESADFDTHLFDSLDADVLLSTDKAQVQAVFASRFRTPTYVAVDRSTNMIVGHAALSLHTGFIGHVRAVLFDFKMSEQFRGTDLELEFLFWLRDCGRVYHQAVWFSVYADAAMAALCEKVGMAPVKDAVLLYYRYPE